MVGTAPGYGRKPQDPLQIRALIAAFTKCRMRGIGRRIRSRHTTRASSMRCKPMFQATPDALQRARSSSKESSRWQGYHSLAAPFAHRLERSGTPAPPPVTSRRRGTHAGHCSASGWRARSSDPDIAKLVREVSRAPRPIRPHLGGLRTRTRYRRTIRSGIGAARRWIWGTLMAAPPNPARGSKSNSTTTQEATPRI